jgi:hypothetical protein
VAGSSPAIFAGQRWAPGVYAYYDWYETSMRELDARGCGIKYIRNETLDAYLEAFSPFQQNQFMPFGRGIFHLRNNLSIDLWGRQRRPDYDLEARLRNRDIVIVTSRMLKSHNTFVPPDNRNFEPNMRETSVLRDPSPPAGFVEYSSRVTPRSYVMPEDNVTLLWVPDRCGIRTAEPQSKGQP